MATPHVGPLPAGTKSCRVCFEPINESALKCIHCQSDQAGWRRRVGVSTTMMSLVVALVSVLAAAVPAFRSLVTPENSDLTFSPQGATADTLSVLVSNKGIRPGSVRSGALAIGSGLMVLHIQDMKKNEPRSWSPGRRS